MAAPVITINSISKYKISDEAGFTQCIVNFTANQTIVGWEARAGGMYAGSGLLVGRGEQLFPASNLYPRSNLYPKNYVVSANTTLSFDVMYNELQQDGNYRINVYAVNSAGEWTPYGG